MIWPAVLYSQESDKTIEDIYSEDKNGELEYYDMEFDLLEETLNVSVDVASLFQEEDLVVGSTVSRINASKWKQSGARRLHEALDSEMSIISIPNLNGAYSTIIRGYAQSGADKGVSFLIDGISIGDIATGSPILIIPNWELATLNKIEIIKGPGSAIYGSDAFHGVISLKTFESDSDCYSIEGAGAYPLYGDAAVRVSQGFGDNLLRIDTAAGASYQGDQDLEYNYNDTAGYDTPLLNIDSSSGTASREFKYNSESGTIKAAFHPSGKLNFKLGFYANKGKYEGFPGVVSVIIPNLDTDQQLSLQDNDLSYNDTLFLMANGSAVYSFANKITVEADGHYWVSEREYKNAASPSSYDIALTTEDSMHRTGGEIIIKQPDNTLNLQWLIAYSLSRIKMDSSHETITLKPAPLAQNYITFDEYDNKIKGYTRTINSVYGQFKWGIANNRIFLSLGCRDDYYSDFGNQLSPKAWIVFLPAKKSSIKTSYGRAFRAPSAVEQTGKTAFVKGDPDLKPEIIDVYEIGYMYKGKKSKVSINTFYSNWKNGIVFEEIQGDTGYMTKFVNKGKNDAAGGELNVFHSLDPFAAEIGFSYVRSRALDVEAAGASSREGDRPYDSFPEYSIKAGLYYMFKPADINFYLNNIVYLKMKEAPDSAKPSPGSLPQYFRMDLNISKIISNKLELYLNVRNLLNRENRMPSLFGADDGYVEPGISVMLRAGYKL